VAGTTRIAPPKPRREPDGPRDLRITAGLRSLLAQALAEDVGTGDVTSAATVGPDLRGEGAIFAKEAGVLCGTSVARCVMRLVDERVGVRLAARDGQALVVGQEIARVRGPMRSILTGERVALNFLQRMSGVATLTRRYVDGLRGEGSAIQVVDTRKTTPLWRALERHAVRAGGGANHRFALYDMYLVKNNHADAAGGVGEALRLVWRHNSGRRRLGVAVEARSLVEVREILEVGADLILLDNMRPAQLRRAARLIGSAAQTEVTGGVTLGRVKALARLPVDRVSIGGLTHSAPALDIALHVRAVENGSVEPTERVGRRAARAER
jgi:nicotinate-nucleotide pyrophosphorylase (carboxylating)